MARFTITIATSLEKERTRITVDAGLGTYTHVMDAMCGLPEAGIECQQRVAGWTLSLPPDSDFALICGQLANLLGICAKDDPGHRAYIEKTYEALIANAIDHPLKR